MAIAGWKKTAWRARRSAGLALLSRRTWSMVRMGVRVSLTSPASSRAGSWPSLRARARKAPTSPSVR